MAELTNSVDGSAHALSHDPDPAATVGTNCEQDNPKKELLHLMDVVQENVSRKNRSFSMSFKKEAIAFAEETSNRTAAKKFKVDGKRIREWRRNKPLIVEACEKGIDKPRLKGGGRKVAHQAMEEELLRWFKEQKENGLLVSRRALMGKARVLYGEMYHNETNKGQFNASAGWLHKFQQRHGLSFRKQNNQREQSPSDINVDVGVVHDVDIQLVKQE